MYNEDKGSDTMLKKAYIVPHPPIILPEVGKGQERSIQNTVNAYRMIAHDIAATKPQTIIIFSSHAPCYRDYIQISQGAQAYGTFEAFGVEDSDMKVLYDEDFVDMLCNAAAAQGLPAGTLGEQNQTLDHGTMVPLHFILQEYTDFRLVRISVSGLDRNTQVLFGDCLRRVIDESQRNVAVIASGDLSHKLKEDGPYGLHPLGAVFDEQIVSIIKDNDYARLLDMDEEIVEESANCGYPAFLMLYGVLQAYPIDSQFLSYEGPFGVGYATAIISVMKKDPYVALARESLEVYIRSQTVLPVRSTLPKELLQRRGGVFVSLKKFGELRGCIGTIAPVQENLAQEIISNAISAGTRDPRFLPVEEKELPYLEYSVDVLKEAEQIESLEELDVKRYGVIVSDEHRRGLLLPDLEGVNTPLQQIRIALNKAGMDPEEPFMLERFEVVRHHENRM